jgi:hypothetical protein
MKRTERAKERRLAGSGYARASEQASGVSVREQMQREASGARLTQIHLPAQV